MSVLTTLLGVSRLVSILPDHFPVSVMWATHFYPMEDLAKVYNYTRLHIYTYIV